MEAIDKVIGKEINRIEEEEERKTQEENENIEKLNKNVFPV